MKLRIKLISIILAMLTTVIVILSIFTLTQSAKMQKATTFQYVEEMAESNSLEIQRRIEIYTGYGSVLAMIFRDYEDVAEHTRRSNYNDFLRSIISKNRLLWVYGQHGFQIQ